MKRLRPFVWVTDDGAELLTDRWASAHKDCADNDERFHVHPVYCTLKKLKELGEAIREALEEHGD